MRGGTHTPAPPRHSAGFRGETYRAWSPPRFSPWARCKEAPHIRGVRAVCMHGVFCEVERGCFDIGGMADFPIPHANTKNAHFSYAPRECGVLPCIEPRVKTRGVTTHAYTLRNAAVWRCGFTPMHAYRPPLFSPIKNTMPWGKSRGRAAPTFKNVNRHP